ncbi:MAG TPA: methionine--tRNA ligase [Candidatus Paceibacterota bacterium]
MERKFYVTTAIPYVNARPHLGHALEFIQADVIARFHRQKGQDVRLLSGSDDNALKNVQAAEQAGMPVGQFIEENSRLFFELSKALGVQLDVFWRGSGKQHHASSQKLWELCKKAGDIYKALYEGLYCVGCEAFYTKDELDDNLECFEHPGRKLERVSEENYFFKLSRHQERLIKIIEHDELRIVPATRKKEVLAFLKNPLRDISISRSNERAKNWGVPVPGDDSQRLYVWFDALNIYQSGVGFGFDEGQYSKWWPADVHVIGKGIMRFHAVYWPAFLLSAGLLLPKTVFVHGYITIDGQKMSKSLGNVVDPFALVEKYGADAVRYFFLREIPSAEDGDFTEEKFRVRYNADLAAGLGNLAARVLTMAHNVGVKASSNSKEMKHAGMKDLIDKTQKEVQEALSDFRFNAALESIWKVIHACDRLIEQERPWSLDPARDQEKQKETIKTLLVVLATLGEMLDPFLPETSEKLAQQLKTGLGESLFPRK